MYFINNNILEKLTDLIKHTYINKDNKLYVSYKENIKLRKLIDIKKSNINIKVKDFHRKVIEIIKIPYHKKLNKKFDINSIEYEFAKFILFMYYDENKFFNRIENINDVKKQYESLEGFNNIKKLNLKFYKYIGLIIPNLILDYNKCKEIFLEYTLKSESKNSFKYFVNDNILKRLTILISNISNNPENFYEYEKNEVIIDNKNIYSLAVKDQMKKYNFQRENNFLDEIYEIIQIPYKEIDENFYNEIGYNISKILLVFIYIVDEDLFFNKISNLNDFSSILKKLKHYYDRFEYYDLYFEDFIIDELILNYKNYKISNLKLYYSEEYNYYIDDELNNNPKNINLKVGKNKIKYLLIILIVLIVIFFILLILFLTWYYFFKDN